MRSNIPPPSQRLIGQGNIPDRIWYDWLQQLQRLLDSSTGDNADLAAKVAALAQQIAELLEQGGASGQVLGERGIRTVGQLPGIVYVGDDEIEFGTDGALLAITVNGYGRISGFRPVTASDIPGTGGVLPVVTGEISSGQPVFVYGPDGSLVYGPI